MKRIKRMLIILITLLSIINIKTVKADEVENNIYNYNELSEQPQSNNKEILKYTKVFFLSLIGVALIILVSGSLNNSKTKNNKKQKEIDIKDLDIDIDTLVLKEQIFKLYKDIQVARTKKSLKLLEPLVTTNLYQKYEKELKELKTNKEKLVITDIMQKEVKLLSINQKENNKYLNVYLHVTQYDYMLDSNKKVIRGVNDTKYQVEYNLEIEYKNKELKINNIKCIGKWISK